MTTYTITTTPRQDAGLVAVLADFNASVSVDLTAAEYLQARVLDVLDSYADAHDIGIVTPYEFVARFTTDEYAAIVALGQTDPQVAGMLARLKAVDAVHLYSPEVQGGVAYLSATPADAPILTADRAAAILTL